MKKQLLFAFSAGLLFIMLILSGCDMNGEYRDQPAEPPASPDSSGSGRFNENLLEGLFGEKLPAITPPDEYQNLIVLYSTDNEFDAKLYEQVRRTYDGAGLNWSAVPLSSSALWKEAIDELTDKDILVIAAEAVPAELSAYPPLSSWVKGGGSLIVLKFNWGGPELDDLAGIQSDTGESRTTSGFRTLKDFFPELDDPAGYTGLNSSGREITLKTGTPDAPVILAESGGFPLIWLNRPGAGRVIYVNSYILDSPSMRGLLLQYTSLAGDFFVATVPYAGLVYLDDFPQPTGSGTSTAIGEQYGISDRAFIRDIWWRDMASLSADYGVNYTSLAIGTYTNRTDTPLPLLTEEEKTVLKEQGALLAGTDAELGIHGYNHVPLGLRGQMGFSEFELTDGWHSVRDMQEGLEHFRTILDELFGETDYYSFVPGMNRMTADGKTALLGAFPGISNLAGIFYQGTDSGVLAQETGRDPDRPDLFALPRYSSGYCRTGGERWNMYNILAGGGVFSHFVHPDDAMDPGRSGGNSWQQLYGELREIIDTVTTDFPDFRWLTSAQYRQILAANETLKVYATREGNRITLRYSGGYAPVYHYLRLNTGESVEGITGGTVRTLQESSGLYLIRGTAPSVTVSVKAP